MTNYVCICVFFLQKYHLLQKSTFSVSTVRFQNFNFATLSKRLIELYTLLSFIKTHTWELYAIFGWIYYTVLMSCKGSYGVRNLNVSFDTWKIYLFQLIKHWIFWLLKIFLSVIKTRAIGLSSHLEIYCIGWMSEKGH